MTFDKRYKQEVKVITKPPILCPKSLFTQKDHYMYYADDTKLD